MVTLSTSLKNLTRIGAITASRLKTLGLSTVKDLLFYYPSRYEDYSHIVSIKDAKAGFVGTVQGQIISIENKITPYKRQKITEALIYDKTGKLKVVWFNQPYLLTQLKVGDLVSFAGKVEYTGFGLEMRSPEWEKGEPRVHTGRLVPIYSLTQGLTQKQVRFLVSQALLAVSEVEEWMPFQNQKSKIKNQNENAKVKNDFFAEFFNFSLIGLQDAVKNIHFPQNKEVLAKAKYRLKFDELFILQLRKAITRHDVQMARAPKIEFKEEAIKKFVQSLPFKLTDAQRKAAWQIIKDCGAPTPMNRLLQGDVGSGKTVVALIATLNTVLGGYQGVLMAPTEILAKQHYATICRLLNGWDDIEVALWTRSAQEIKNQKSNPSLTLHQKLVRGKIKKKMQKSKILEFIQQGKANIILGTHALIQESIQFHKLGLAIVDEQHRFGVEQRKALREKVSAALPGTTQKIPGSIALSPHFLSMTATPIPRSLALTAYGDLDLSILNEMPPGRKTVITKVVAEPNRAKAYDFINQQIQQGRQVFVICPLIDESDVLGVKAVTTEFEKLDKEVFPHLKVGLLHGKLKDKEKDEVQEKFLKGEYKILVASSVVEVGVDVPNASVMMIEGAERFGLAQLHQFRGRVGRSEHQSYCFLFTDSTYKSVYDRLEFLTTTTDGFKIAEFDLQIRGAGNLYGTEQHGLPEFKIASLHDYQLIELTQELARSIIEQDPRLQTMPTIRRKLDEEGGSVHLE